MVSGCRCCGLRLLCVCLSVHEAGYSLWLGVPFGFTRHGEALVEREGDEGAGRLRRDGGQLLNLGTQKQGRQCEGHDPGPHAEHQTTASGSQPFGLVTPVF